MACESFASVEFDLDICFEVKWGHHTKEVLYLTYYLFWSFDTLKQPIGNYSLQFVSEGLDPHFKVRFSYQTKKVLYRPYYWF